MIRALHRWPGILSLVFLVILALSGAALSVFPAAERLSGPQSVARQSIADLAALVAASHPGLEEIRRSPSGTITAWWFEGGTPGSAVIDPATGADDVNALQRIIFILEALGSSCRHQKVIHSDGCALGRIGDDFPRLASRRSDTPDHASLFI